MPEITLEEEAALVCCRLGVELLLHCDLAGISTDEAFELIIKRGEYLMQEPLLFDLGDE
jgi:hypothetical protein